MPNNFEKPLARLSRMALAVVLVLVARDGLAQTAEPSIPAPATMTADYLKNPKHIETGKTVWEDQCRHCHGASAYPGKAPQLTPARYRTRPDFVWDRVTNGFRKMPAWKDVYSEEERMGVVAYILSDSFNP